MMRAGDLLEDRFELDRQIGSGGSSIVYRALDYRTGAWVAVKALRPLEPGDRERFAREATLLAELHHPAVVEYVAHGLTDSGRPYIVMEWIEGETLEKRLARGPLSIADAISLCRRMGEALGVAHQRNIIHRDIKPGNIMLRDGQIDASKLLDFGVARSSFGLGLTLTGALVGTPGYMSPEQARGEKELDPRADVFALGCLMFRCLAGRPVFQGNDLLATILKVVVEDAPRLSTIVPETPPQLDALVARMLSRALDARPRDGSAVGAELAAIAEDKGRGAPDPAPIASGTPALTTTERRLVCLVLVRASAPEALAAQAPAIRVLIERHRGVFERLADGSLLGVLSGDGAPTDQAARAARCALSMREIIGDAPIALVTGRAVIGETRPVGEAIDRAVALIPLDADGVPKRRTDRGLWLDEVTAGLLASRFDISGDEAGLFLYRERDLGAESRTLLGRPTPCVGRERELSTLLAGFDACVAGSSARAVLVTAGPGAGKSRLRHELIARLAARGSAVEVLLGAGDAMSAGAPFGVIAAALRRAAGVLADEPLAVRRRKLAARVGRHLPPRDRPRVSEFLGELVFSPSPDQSSDRLRAARQNPTLKGDQMRLAWEDWLAAECRAQPVLIVLEDLQWGDLPSVQFIDAALRNLADRPLMVLGLARPEVRKVFRDLWADRVVIPMELENLTPAHSELLARQVLGEDARHEVVARVVEQAAGNAFYLEELIRAVAEGRGHALPETVVAMLEARLADLTPAARRVLRAASVFGQVVSEGGVRALLGGALGAAEIKSALAELLRREALTPAGEVRFAGDPGYAFRNALVREAAYAMLTDEDRALGHRLAASFLERESDGEALGIAEHFERAGEGKRAASWYLRAAEQALSGCDDAAALSCAKRGIACGAEGEELGRTTLVLAQAHQSRGESVEAEARALEAMRWLPWGSERWYMAIAEAASAGSGQGHLDGLKELAAVLHDAVLAGERSRLLWIAAARTVGSLYQIGREDLGGGLLDLLEAATYAGAERDPEVRGRLHSALAKRARYEGDPASYLAERQAAAAALEEAGDMRGACMEQVNVGFALLELGVYAEAERMLRTTLTAADRLDLRAVRAAAYQNLGFALSHLGALDEACRLERQAVAQFAAQGNRRMEGGSRIYLAAILERRGELADAEREAAAAAAVLTAAPPLRPNALATYGHVLLGLGRADEALRATETAVELATALGYNNAEGEVQVFLVHAEALFATGDHEGARETIAGARARLLERAAKITDVRLRESFLNSVPEHQRTIALAAAWLGAR